MNVPLDDQGSTPVPAATVMLLRPAVYGELEVFMLRRSSQSAFAPDAYVFPGGTQDEADGLIEMTALRELYEEAGILLALDRSQQPPPGEKAAHAARSCRTYADALAALNVLPNVDALARFSHWVTPPSQPRRFDTWFFLALAPEDQAAEADKNETHDGRWIVPSDALAQQREGKLHLIYPTIKHLERLANFRTPDDAIAFARTKPIVTIEPQLMADRSYGMPPELENRW